MVSTYQLYIRENPARRDSGCTLVHTFCHTCLPCFRDYNFFMNWRLLLMLLLAPMAWTQTAPDMAAAPHYRQLLVNSQVRVFALTSAPWNAPWRGTTTTSW